MSLASLNDESLGCLPGETGAAFCSCKTGFPPARILSFGQKRWRIMNDSEQMVLIDAPVVYQGRFRNRRM